MSRWTFCLAPMLLLAFSSPARPCTPDPSYWSLAEVWPPEEGSIPLDGILLVRGELFGESGDVGWFGGVLDVVVLDGEEPVAGQLGSSDEDEAIWRADAPLEAGVTYTIVISVYADELGEPTELRMTRTAGAVDVSASPAFDGATAEAWTRPRRTCVREREDYGSCDWCEEYGVTATEERIRLVVSVPRPEGPAAGSLRALVRVGATEAEAAEGGAQVGQRFWGAGRLSLAADLGERAEWAGGEACFAVGLEAPGGEPEWGAPSCLAIEDNTETIPLHSEGGGGGGCAATSGTPAGWAWGLLLIVGAGRRRLRRAPATPAHDGELDRTAR